MDPLAVITHEAALYPHIAEGVVGAICAVGLSAINSLPPKMPRTVEEFYQYIRETLQLAVPIRSNHPIPPAGPAKE